MEPCRQAPVVVTIIACILQGWKLVRSEPAARVVATGKYSEFSLPPDLLEQLESFRGLRDSAFAKEFWAAYAPGGIVAILVDNLVVPTFLADMPWNAVPIPASAAATNGQYPIVTSTALSWMLSLAVFITDELQSNIRTLGRFTQIF